MSLLRLQLLGPPRAWRDDQLLRFKRRKTLALLAYLGTESGLHARDALAALLWPETAGGDARSSLRTTLVDLRQVLGESALTATREAVGHAAGRRRRRGRGPGDAGALGGAGAGRGARLAAPARALSRAGRPCGGT